MTVEQGNRHSITWAWGGLAVVAGLAVMAVGVWHSLGGGDDHRVGAASQPVQAAPHVAGRTDAANAAALADAETPAVATRQVSATDLFRQFRDSQGRAGEQYRQQRLGLSGTLASMEEGAEGVLVLALQAGPDLETIRAVMTPAHRARALAVSPGTPVALDCLHQGAVMGEPLLVDCRLAR